MLNAIIYWYLQQPISPTVMPNTIHSDRTAEAETKIIYNLCMSPERVPGSINVSTEKCPQLITVCNLNDLLKPRLNFALPG